jgi:hypothetical protein
LQQQHAKEALDPKARFRMVGGEGFEPPTSSMSS